MFRQQYTQINESLRETKKAIVALGCSFVQGQGALSPELLTKYQWEVSPTGFMFPKLSEEQKQEIQIEYNLRENFGRLDFTFVEYQNSFVNVLCDKYLFGEYTPINFGMRGNGNRASIKQLYMHPGIQWDLIEELIVLYMPTGLERFDFAQDNLSDHFNFVTMWPHYRDPSVTGDKKKLWEGYAKTIWGETHEVIEQILSATELVSWCKTKNARLITLLGFDARYKREYFLEKLIAKSPKNAEHVQWANLFVDQFPWDTMTDVGGYESFIQYTMKQENLHWHNMWSWRGRGTPNKWLTPCCHPSAIAHDGYARLLSELI